jgi:hypothetical protein
MLEAMDTELGRFLSHVDWVDTTVIFLGDNGPQRVTIEPPFNRAHGKGSVYEGGVNVPLIVRGQAVPASRRGRQSQALVQATDLFATVLEIADASGSAEDSVSLVPYLLDPSRASVRPWVYTELFLPNGGPIDPATHLRAARGTRYKVVRNGLEADELYDLLLDPFEHTPIDLGSATASQRMAYTQLTRVIDASGGQCADGLDNDGDGYRDYPSDPGCRDLASTPERTACQDGLDNDRAAGIDFDGGASVNGGVPISPADPQCSGKPWRNTEGTGLACGLGFEVALALLPLAWGRRRQRSRDPAAGTSMGIRPGSRQLTLPH